MNDKGRRQVLVIEDEVLVAMLVEDMLLDLGCEVTAVSTHLSEALALAKSQTIDFAILDLNLNGQPSFPVADVLRARGIPFVFATGYGAKGLRDPYTDAPTLEKPFQLEDLVRALGQIGFARDRSP